MFKNLFMIWRQKPCVLHEFVGVVADSDTQSSDDVPLVGWKEIVGGVYSSEKVTLNIRQGLNENAGAFLYRDLESWSIGAGGWQPFIVIVHGRFAKLEVVNASGSPSNVEIHAILRAI